MRSWLSIGAMLLVSFAVLLLFDWIGRKLERFLDSGIDRDEAEEEPMEVSRRELDRVRHPSHQEFIVCPSCLKECEATVEHTAPWWSYAHECEHCGLMITESEWETSTRGNPRVLVAAEKNEEGLDA